MTAVQATALIIFVCAAILAVYILVGYPLLLALLARHPRPVRRHPQQPSVSILLPIRNGAPFVEAKLRSLLSLDYPRELIEILVISDASDDGTDDLVRQFASEGVRLLRVPRGGKPAALNAGIPQLNHEILLLTDVRQIVAPDSLRHLVACFADPQVGVVSGTLLIRAGENQEAQDVGLYWRFETWIREQLSAIDSMLGATGPFYAMRRDLAVPIPPEVLLDDVYLPLSAFFRGYRLIVEPAAKAYDFPTSLHSEFRRKVRTLAGNYQLLKHYPNLLTPANRMWLHYVSYKLGRLALPWLLIALFASSLFLPWPWRTFTITLQLLAYAPALVDPAVPEQSPLKRLTSPIRSFAVMMAAALCAVSVIFVPPQSLWKETRVQGIKSVSSRS